jgi:hypothetical protein
VRFARGERNIIVTTEQTPEDEEHTGVFDPDDDPDNPYDPDKVDDDG